MAAEINFNFADNAPQTYPLRFEDENGQSWDFTGSTFKLVVKANTAGSALLTLTTGSGIAGTLSQGECTITFPAAGLAPGSYVYDLVRLVSAAIVERMQFGAITVTKGISS